MTQCVIRLADAIVSLDKMIGCYRGLLALWLKMGLHRYANGPAVIS